MIEFREPKPKEKGIYTITNIKNKKIYIGSSIDLQYRLYCHFRDLRLKVHCNNRLQNSYNKYGEENFVYEVIEYVEKEEDCIPREQYYLNTLLFAQEYIQTKGKDERFLKLGLNIQPTAGSPLGVVYSQERLVNMSKITTLLWEDPEFRALQMRSRQYVTGWKHKDSTIELIRDKAKKRFEEDPERVEYYRSMMADPERKKKSREDSLNLWKDPEYRSKIHTPESAEKNRTSTIERWKDPEYNKKRLETWNKTKSDPNYMQGNCQQVLFKHTTSGKEIHFKNVGEARKFLESHKVWTSPYDYFKNNKTVLGYSVIYLPKGTKYTVDSQLKSI